MTQPTDDSGPWHVHAISVLERSGTRDWWISSGRATSTPVLGSRQVPGGWVLPGGLVDAHVHLTMNFGKAMPHADGSDGLIAANAAAQLRAGVLALRDAGHAWGGVPRESANGPHLQRAGSLIAPPGRGYPQVCRAAAASDLVAVAMGEIAAGAAWVKVLGDFPAADGNWFAAPSNYPRDVLATLVREAHAAGARVMGHATGLGAADLIAAGVDSIEHGTALTRDLAREMADRGTAWTPTLATALKHVGALAAEPSPVGAYIRSQFDRLRDVLPYAASVGVPVLAGTDEMPMGALWRELIALTEFGLTPAQALSAGSGAARSWLGFPLPDEALALTFVTFDRDPLTDLLALASPAAVVFNGSRTD